MMQNVLLSVSGAQQRFPACRVSWFLKPSRHLSRSCASNLCKPQAVMSHSSISFQLFFGLPFFVPSTSKSSAFTGPLSSSILSRMSQPSQSFLSETLPISLHPSFHESSHCSFYLSRFSHISFAIVSFLWSSASFLLPFSMPNIQHHKLEHFSQLLYKVPLTFNDMLLPHISLTFETFSNFFHADLILDVTAS